MLRKIVNLVLVSVVLLLCNGVTVEAKTTYDVPEDNAFKAYMDYRSITNKKSKQWRLQQLCTTAENGVRLYGDRYCIAIGRGFDVKIGSAVDVYLEDGSVIYCVVGDLKQNRHTDDDNMQVRSNGNIVEFIVDKDAMDPKVAKSGNLNKLEEFSGEITCIEVDDAVVIPDYTIISKYRMPVDDDFIYVITYRLGDHTDAVEVSKDEYNRYQIFSSLYSVDED